MTKRRKAIESPALPDGYYWFRNFINLRGGGHVDVWKMARVVGGLVWRVGSEAEWKQDCDYLRDAVWVRAEPPSADGGYECDDTRAMVAKFGFTAHVRARGEEARELKKEAGEKARRWVFERTHSWMNHVCRLLTQWEQKAENCLGHLFLVCDWITYMAADLMV